MNWKYIKGETLSQKIYILRKEDKFLLANTLFSELK